MEIEFSNKVVLVSGATSGIGQAAAQSFSQSGARMMLTGRNADALAEMQETIRRSGGNCSYLAGDLTDSAFRIQLMEKTIEIHDQLDIQVNAAGIIGTGSVEKTSLEEFDYMMDINLRAVFHMMQLAIPHLVRTAGNIVNVGSVTGVRAFPGIMSYCVSKAGLDQLTRVASLELAPQNVRVNGINPGVIITNLHRRGGMDEVAYEKFLQHSKTTHPMGRVGTPQEAADLILFLASPKAAWLTGMTISIDGGRHLTCAR